MKQHPQVMQAIRRELSDWRLWSVRAVVMGFAVLSGLTVVLFTWLTEQALQAFHALQGLAWWAPLLWTPLGAALLARGPRRVHVQEPAALQRALDSLPVWLLGPGREHWEALQGMGLATLADLRRLPRSGLARRFGGIRRR